MGQQLAQGVVHAIPPDLHTVLCADASLFERWQDLTPLARNEWICWVIAPKKVETRNSHINRLRTDLLAGKRRPCCWAGCPHRQKTHNPK